MIKWWGTGRISYDKVSESIGNPGKAFHRNMDGNKLEAPQWPPEDDLKPQKHLSHVGSKVIGEWKDK